MSHENEKDPELFPDVVHDLVDAIGADAARVEITRALCLPAPGSHWRYSDPGSPADRFEIAFVRHVGDFLLFNGPAGEWHCAREDWDRHLATARVRPLLLPDPVTS